MRSGLGAWDSGVLSQLLWLRAGVFFLGGPVAGKVYGSYVWDSGVQVVRNTTLRRLHAEVRRESCKFSLFPILISAVNSAQRLQLIVQPSYPERLGRG